MEQATEVKKNNGMKVLAIVCAICALAAIGGCAYGVTQAFRADDLQKEKDKLQSELAKKNEQPEVTMTTDCISIDEYADLKLTKDKALELLQAEAKSMGVAYEIAEVKITGENKEKNQYWVVYGEKHSDYTVYPNVIFTADGKGGWDFTIPGFSGYTDKTTEGFTFYDGSTNGGLGE
jgi:hypothetical protein